MYRTGEVVFAQLSYEWKIKRQLLKGSAPARLLRFFMWDDEEDASQGEKRLMVEQAWLWNHDTIMTVPGAEEVIPATIIHMMREDPKKYLQGDLMTCEEFETMLSDATCYRHSEEWAMPEADVHAFVIVGAVEFDISQEDGTVVNRVKTFAPWAASKTLLESTPACSRATRATTRAVCARYRSPAAPSCRTSVKARRSRLAPTTRASSRSST